MTKTEFILAGLLPVLTLSAKEAHKPNVLMICVDDMNGFGTKKEYPLCKTPYIDKLKSQGIIFSNAVANSPVCNPSRSSFFSGLLASTTGAYLNVITSYSIHYTKLYESNRKPGPYPKAICL